MIAWSLSGGGNRAPVQIGAMRALYQAGIRPDMLVGTSAGALNAAFLATDPTPAGLELLAQLWLETKAEDIFADDNLARAIRFITGADGLNSSDALHQYILKHVPSGIVTFGDLNVKLYMTTADLQTGQLFLYGDDPNARLVDAAMASTALPVAWPPVEYRGHQFVDGAVVANVPISIALDKGADTVYALDLESSEPSPVAHGVYDIGMRAISVMVYQQLLRDLERVTRFSHATLHHIYLGNIFNGLPLEDFTHTAEMIELGYERARQYLAHPTPNQLSQPVSTAAAGPVICPPGAVPYNPPR